MIVNRLLVDIMIVGLWTDHSPSSFSSSLCGQFEKSTSPSGWIGVKAQDPRFFNLSERSPDCA